MSIYFWTQAQFVFIVLAADQNTLKLQLYTLRSTCTRMTRKQKCGEGLEQLMIEAHNIIWETSRLHR